MLSNRALAGITLAVNVIMLLASVAELSGQGPATVQWTWRGALVRLAICVLTVLIAYSLEDNRLRICVLVVGLSSAIRLIAQAFNFTHSMLLCSRVTISAICVLAIVLSISVIKNPRESVD